MKHTEMSHGRRRKSRMALSCNSNKKKSTDYYQVCRTALLNAQRVESWSREATWGAFPFRKLRHRPPNLHNTRLEKLCLRHDGFFQQDNSQSYKPQIISKGFLEHLTAFTGLRCPPQSLDLIAVEHLCDVIKWESCIIEICSNCVMLSC